MLIELLFIILDKVNNISSNAIKQVRQRSWFKIMSYLQQINIEFPEMLASAKKINTILF